MPQRFVQPAIRELIAERVARHGFLLGSTATLGAVAANGFVGSPGSQVQPRLQRAEARLRRSAPGRRRYQACVVAAWSDPIMPGLGGFDPATLDAAGQTERFGYNCDYLAYMPLPKGSDNSERACFASTTSMSRRT